MHSRGPGIQARDMRVNQNLLLDCFRSNDTPKDSNDTITIPHHAHLQPHPTTQTRAIAERCNKNKNLATQAASQQQLR
jgi:hypothetical protein